MILSLKDVRKSYGATRALDGISLDVGRGEIVAVLGPNGAGKTTAIEIAIGLRAPDSGDVRLFERSPRDPKTRLRLGVTPQESGFPDALSVGEIVRFGTAHYPHPAPTQAILSAFGLKALSHRRAGALSGGESRRLAVALAFAGNPDLVVLDEPTTGLDVESRRQLWDVVRDYAVDRSVLFTTHYLEEAQALATRVVVVDSGRVLFDGSTAELRGRFGARRLSYAGKDGHVVVTIDDTDEYVRRLVRDGVAFSNLEIVPPTLEEAFLTVTGGRK
ncbi:MAG TPA: ABC transporter ATP-binding protein [Candidatus Baltobacteraceae bacterium]|nr:ABC transporter ATP-binding protein [Candidatus Baltobacteraceae bacterium]